MKRVAVTRAEPEASATAARVAAMGAAPVPAPLLRIETRALDARIDGVQALLFTSANGVRAWAGQSPARDLRALCVGAATATAAREAGFADVTAADGDSRALAQLALQTLSAQAGRVLHISGAHVASDMAETLRQAGFEAERRVAYEAVAAQDLPPALANPCDIVLFHSARAAETFIALGAPHANQSIAACLSPAVAQAASDVTWKSLIVAPRPREQALLQAALSPSGAIA